MFIGQPRRVKLPLELGVENFFEQILEATVVHFQNRIFRRQIHSVIASETVSKTGTGKTLDRFIEVVHRHRNTGARRFEHFFFNLRAAVVRRELHRERPGTRKLKIGGTVLIAEPVTRDHHRLVPMRHQARHVRANNRFAKNSAVENIANGAVGRLPHLLEIEFLDARFIRRNRCALHGDTVLLGRHRRIDRHLIVGRIAMFHAQIVVLKIDIKIRKDKFLANHLPDDAGHFIAIHFDDGVLYLDFCHGEFLRESK